MKQDILRPEILPCYQSASCPTAKRLWEFVGQTLPKYCLKIDSSAEEADFGWQQHWKIYVDEETFTYCGHLGCGDQRWKWPVWYVSNFRIWKQSVLVTLRFAFPFAAMPNIARIKNAFKQLFPLEQGLQTIARGPNPASANILPIRKINITKKNLLIWQNVTFPETITLCKMSGLGLLSNSLCDPRTDE